MNFIVFVLLLTTVCNNLYVVYCFDPYETLRIGRNAQPADVKRAYKSLARKWHPDKNPSPEAQEEFVKINRAYELLSDAERRARFDRYGDTDERRDGGGQQQWPFDDPAVFPGGGQWNNFRTRTTVFTKHRIDSRMYNAVLEKSHTIPYLIFIYSDWCVMCMRAEGIWERLVQQLEPVGYGIATVNSMRDGYVIDKLGVTREPSIVALIDGRQIVYRANVIDTRLLIDFARNVLQQSSDLVNTGLWDGNYRQWLTDNWRVRNKVSVIMCGPQERPRLRFLIAAMRYRSYAAFGYIPLKLMKGSAGKSVEEFRSAYHITTSSKHVGGLESFLLFNERIDTPSVVIRAKEIDMENLISALESNKFLIVPRLSSRKLFHELCPLSPSSANSKNFRQYLCVVLILDDYRSSSATASDDQNQQKSVDTAVISDQKHLDAYREFVEHRSRDHHHHEEGSDHRDHRDRDHQRFMYVYKNRQMEFVNTMIAAAIGGGDRRKRQIDDDNGGGDRRDIAVLWRTNARTVKFEWLRDIWSGHPDYANRSGQFLMAKLEEISVHDRGSGGGVVEVVDLDRLLVDEHGPGWFRRVLLASLGEMYDRALAYLGKEELFPMISVLGTLFAMLLLASCMNFLAARSNNANNKGHRHDLHHDQSSHYRSPPSQAGGASKKKPAPDSGGVDLKELTISTYSEMVLDSQPGVRTIVILVRQGGVGKERLLTTFARHLIPWKFDKNVRFGYVEVEKNLDWFSRLFSAAEVNKDKAFPSIIRRCHPNAFVGVVLSLNGYRRYFNIFYPTSGPRKRVGRWMTATTKEKDQFLGFDTSSSDSDDSDDDQQVQEQDASVLLEGLPRWLERLFEGCCEKLSIEQWAPIK